jgi:hypothetical protein
MELSPVLRLIVAFALVAAIGLCTRVVLDTMQRMKAGVVSKLEGVAMVVLMATLVISSIPLARWLGILPP